MGAAALVAMPARNCAVVACLKSRSSRLSSRLSTRAAAGQIALHGLVERAAVLPGWIVETPVALRGPNLRAPEPDADEFCGQHGRLAASGRGLPQHEGRARQHLAHHRPPSRIRTGDRVQGLVCHASLPYRINSLLYSLTEVHLGIPSRHEITAESTPAEPRGTLQPGRVPIRAATGGGRFNRQRATRRGFRCQSSTDWRSRYRRPVHNLDRRRRRDARQAT